MSQRRRRNAPRASRVTTFREGIDYYLVRCRARNLSPRTIEWYEDKLTNVAKYLETECDVTKLADLDEEHLWSFLADRQQRAKPVTVNGYVQVLKSFLRFIGSSPSRPHLAHCYDLAYRIEKIKDPDEGVIQTFTHEQILSLLEMPTVGGYEGFRDRVIMEILYGTGVRISEAVGIRRQDIEFDNRRIFIHLGKGRKSRYVPMPESLVPTLEEYLAEVEDLGDDEPIFRAHNRPVNPKTIGKRIKAYGRMAGIEGVDCRPHVFRHTFAKQYILNGGDAFTLQRILGHTTMKMVRNYVNMTDVDVNSAFRRSNPLDRLYLKRTG